MHSGDELTDQSWETHMGCCFDTSPATLALAPLDPSKHVNYVLGMVLGEDDFKQEFAYLSGRDQWLARDLIGYGTVRGLAVRVDIDGANGPRVYVDAGAAISPSGQLICVPAPQCAHINDWLAKNSDKVPASPAPDGLTLYVVLRYRDCPADDVPIPGEPCRTEDQLVKPSRLRDDFCLELTLDPPRQREEAAVRDFCQWLRQVDMSDASAVSTPLEQFLDAIRQAAAPWFVASPPASPPVDFLFGSPPSDIRINPRDACEYLRAAFRVWVTELRPKWIERWYGCAPNAQETPMGDCVLLAQITVALLPAGGGVFESDDHVTPSVNEDQRPFVLHLRMLQEWLLCGTCCSGGSGSSATDPQPATAVAAQTAFGLAANVGASVAYARADHTHGTPSLAGDVTVQAGSTQIASIQSVPVAAPNPTSGQVLGFNGAQWQPTTLSAPAIALAGDVTGQAGSTQIASIQSVPVVAPNPTLGQVLGFNGAQWQPTTPSAPAIVLSGEVTGATGMTRVGAMLGKSLPATPMQDGQVLAFSPAGWVPTEAPVGRRNAAKRYSIVAAGRFPFTLTRPNTTAVPTGQLQTGRTPPPAYNGLRPTDINFRPNVGGFSFTFVGCVIPYPDNRNESITYIVKVTPMSVGTEPLVVTFIAHASGFRNDNGIPSFSVMPVMSPTLTNVQGVLMIEVSEFAR